MSPAARKAKQKRDLREAFDVLMRSKSGSDSIDVNGSGPLAPAFATGYVLSSLARMLAELGDAQPEAIVHERYSA